MTKDSGGKLPLPRSVAISERGRLERRGRGRVAISVDFGELKLHSRTRTKKNWDSYQTETNPQSVCVSDENKVYMILYEIRQFCIGDIGRSD